MKFDSILLASLSVIALSVAQPTLAQRAEQGSGPQTDRASADNGNELEEVMVTARRVSESLQTVPISVTALTPEALRDEQITDVTSLERVTPSLTVTRAQRGSSTPALMVRGQRNFQSNTLSDPSVTIYFAEVGQSMGSGGNSAFYDLDSVQVLKGPQGTLFGRNTTGGAVLVTPKAPSDELEGYGQVSLGDYSHRDYEGAVNIPLTDGLSVRAAGKITRTDGYMYNPQRDVDAENQNSDSARVSLRYHRGNFDSTSIYYYFKEDVVNANRLNLIVPARVTPVRPVSLPALRASLDSVNSLGKYDYLDNAPQLSDTRINGVQNITKIEFDSVLDELAFRNIFGYRDLALQSSFDIDGSDLDSLFNNTQSDIKSYSEEAQLVGKSGPLAFVAGLYYYMQNGFDTSVTNEFGYLAPVAPAIFPIVGYGDYDTKNSSYAAYAHADYQLRDKLTLSLGARETRDEREIVYRTRTNMGGPSKPTVCTLTGAVNTSPDRGLCAFEPSPLIFTEPTYDASLEWQVSRDTLVYGAYRHGYRTGGFNNNPPSPAVIREQAFRPEKVDDFELGVKTDLHVANMAGRFNLAVYYDTLNDAQRTINVPAPGSSQISSIIANAGKAHVKGGEAELLLKPIPDLTLTLNGSIIDASYSSFTDTYLVGGVVTPVDVSASKFAQVPKYQINASTSYDIPINHSAGGLSISASYYYQSNVQTHEINSTYCGPDGLYPGCFNGLGVLPSYSLVNLRADWKDVFQKRFDLAFYVNNVADKYYYTAASPAINLVGLQAVYVGPPRMYGVEVRYEF